MENSRFDYDRHLQDKKAQLTAATDKIIDAHASLEEKALTGSKITSMPLERPLGQSLDNASLENKSLGEKIIDSANNALETTKETIADAATWVKEHTLPSKEIQESAKVAATDIKEAAIDLKEGVQETLVKAKEWVQDHILPDSEKTAGEKLEENLHTAKETLAEGFTVVKEKLGEAAGMVNQALQPETQQQLKSKAKKLGRDAKQGAEELLDEAGNKIDQGAKKGRRRARRGGRRLKKEGEDLGDKAKEFIEDAGDAIHGAIQKNAPRKAGRFNKRGNNQRGGYMVWVPKGSQATAEQGKDLLGEAKNVAAQGWEATKEKAGEALDWADKKLTPESQKTLGDKANEFGDKVKDKADDLAFKAKEKITPESQKTVGDKFEEKAFHAKEAVKEKLE